MADELLPCGCGKVPKLKFGTTSYGGKSFRTSCVECACGMNSGYHRHRVLGNSVFIWNARQDKAAISRAEAALKPAYEGIEGESHCKDCCCAQSWKALGISEYTGKSIPEHIAELRVLQHERIDDTDEPQNWRELAEAAIGDLGRYANDEGPERRMVSFRAYSERAEILSSRQHASAAIPENLTSDATKLIPDTNKGWTDGATIPEGKSHD